MAMEYQVVDAVQRETADLLSETDDAVLAYDEDVVYVLEDREEE